jgi:hypothetical protein
MLKVHECRDCGMQLYGAFYYYNVIREARNNGQLNQRPPVIQCLGCQLVDVLYTEHDHYKREKCIILDMWIRDAGGLSELNTNDLGKFLKDFDDKPEILEEAEKLEKSRQGFINKFNYDKEWQEKQRRAGDREGKRLSKKYLSSTMEKKMEFLRLEAMTPEEKQWSDHPDMAYRPYGHGHGGLD